MEISIEWSEPYQVVEKEKTMWRRIWLIPIEYRSAFFAYWKGAKFKLREEGFSVFKENENDWFLAETKKTCLDFKSFTQPKEKTPPPEEDFWLPPYKVKDISGLRPWQIDSVSKLVSAINKWNSAIDGSDLGIGKTYVACAVAREINHKIVVVCPKAVMASWKRVICKHFKMKDSLIGIINYEQLRTGKKDSPIASYVMNRKTHREKFTWKIPKDTLIIWDESQKLKNFKTQNSKTCVEAIKQKFKMLFCSATNATNPLELRTVGTAIKLFSGPKQYYEWLYEHGVFKGRFGLMFTEDKKIKEKVLKKLNKDIFEHRGVRLTRDTIPGFPESDIIADCYDMDDIQAEEINSVHATMEKELRKLHALIKRDKASELTAVLRARQQIELIKVPLFIEIIEEGLENGMSVAVFLNFTETIDAIARRLKTSCIFDGKTKDDVRQKNVENFQNNNQRVILINIASGGAGLSLHDLEGNHPRLALISPNYSAVLMRQATGRVWRDDAKTKSIQKIVFVAKTVEEKVCKNLQEKLKNLDLLNDGDLSITNVNYDFGDL